MNDHLLKILKAALLSAAFLFFTGNKEAGSIENIKNKAGQLMAMKKKDQAIQLIINYSQTERSKIHKAEAQDLLFNIAQSFMTKEAQEAYESSLNNTLDNEKTAMKDAELCLKAEPQNLDCLIQKARLAHRAENSRIFKNTIDDIKVLLSRSVYIELFQMLADRANPTFRERQIISLLPQPPAEKTLLYVVLEIERAFSVKNYSRTKDLLVYVEKNYADWPDLAYFKNKLNNESTENRELVNDDLLTYYANKCKSISKSNARKYRYDFDLCNRGKKA